MSLSAALPAPWIFTANYPIDVDQSVEDRAFAQSLKPDDAKDVNLGVDRYSDERRLFQKSIFGIMEDLQKKRLESEILPEESRGDFQFQYSDDGDDDDDDDDDDGDESNKNGGTGVAPRGGGQVQDYDTNLRFPSQQIPRGRLGEVDPMPSERLVGTDFRGVDDRMLPLNGGPFDLPSADRGSGNRDPFRDGDLSPFSNRDRERMGPSFGSNYGPNFGSDFGPDFGPNFGPSFGSMDFGPNRDGPEVDEPYPPRPLDVDDPMMSFKDINDDDALITEKRTDDGTAEAEIKASCGSIPVTEYLTLKFGSFGMTILILLLLYMCAVAVFAHCQWMGTGPGDKELL